MSEATADIYLDEKRPRKDKTCSVKIKITYNRKRKYVSTDVFLTPVDFAKVMGKPEPPERKARKYKDIETDLLYKWNKANEIIKKLSVFTFDKFEEHYFEKRNVSNSISYSFDKYIEQLQIEKRIGTAESYKSTKKSLETFKKNLTFADITPTLLKKYEKWMLDNGKSITTVGIYLRSLRSIFNFNNIDKSLYPFGEGRGKYSIPTGKNTKKALTIDEISKIYNYKAPENSTKAMAKDYWIFLYLCNGMNVKDFCYLKWNNIKNDVLTYTREKTKRSRKESKQISVSLKPETWDIIKKWGQPSILEDDYIFPHIKKGMTAENQQAIIKQLTKTVNKYMKQIAHELNIDKDCTTYFARHSFATVLKRSGAKIELISELLGHSSVLVTGSYLDSFEKEFIQEQTNVLTAAFKKAN